MARPLRYTAIVALTAVGTALAAVGGWKFARASAPVNGPIILISIDTLRADHLPAYGYRNVRTPAIDALVADGVVFERAYAHAPQTLPAHVSILSGRLPFETGVRDDAGFTVKRGERLLPSLLRERGYATAGVVSAFLLRADTGINQGFDFFDAEMPSDAPDAVKRDGSESETIAERWLGQQRSSRLFLFLHLYEPHAPYSPPSRFASYAPYDGEIAYADEIFGRLMHYLKSHQLYDQSTIVLVSDHGEGLGDHGEQGHGLFLYDEAVHVPLIVKLAAGIGAGRRVADLVQQVDLVPTILDLVKAPIPGSLRGRSLTPLLEGAGRLPEQPVYSEALYGRYRFGWSELVALTDGRYRYIKAPREELYDLRRDAHERDNVFSHTRGAPPPLGSLEAPPPALGALESLPPASDGADQAAKLRKALDRLVAGAKILPPAAVAAEDREPLQALGYVAAQDDTPAADSDEPRSDPKDKREIADTYRAAVALADGRKWHQAIALLQGIAKDNPGLNAVWGQIAAYASCIDRYDVAVDAYQHLVALAPSDAEAHLGAALTLLKMRKLDEARDHAERAAHVAGERAAASRSAAHVLLARIALNRRDADQARREADLARQADHSLPMPAYVDARLLYDEGRFAEALPFFERALAEIRQSHARPMQDLHSYTADALARLERYPDAEAHYVEELRDFPQNIRARAGLATLYHATGRTDEAGDALVEMIQKAPTPDSYALAARMWRTFGNPGRADAIRAEARRAFAGPPRNAHQTRPNATAETPRHRD